METRCEFILKFLNLTDNHEDLDKNNYMQDRLHRFQFAKRHNSIVANVQTLVFWNKIRAILAGQRDEIFEIGTKNTLNMSKAVRLLVESGLQADETFCFFDQLFDIC